MAFCLQFMTSQRREVIFYCYKSCHIWNINIWYCYQKFKLQTYTSIIAQKVQVECVCFVYKICHCSRLHARAVDKGRPANGEGGGFEISDIPGRGEGVVCVSSDVQKFLKKWNSKISLSSLKLKLEIIIDRDSNMRAFTYDVCSNLGVSK